MRLWTVRISVPDSSRCVANEWRIVWQVARFGTPALRTASLIWRCMEDSCRWWRATLPVRGWGQRVAEDREGLTPLRSVQAFWLRYSKIARNCSPCVQTRLASARQRSRPAPKRHDPTPACGSGVMADREGFEPSVTLLPHTLSKRAHSTTLTPALGGRDPRNPTGPWQPLFKTFRFAAKLTRL